MRRYSFLSTIWGIIVSLLSMAAFLPAPAMNAQSVTGSIYGTVTDSSGAAIPKASVSITNVDTNQTITTTSGGSGEFVFPSIDPGTYKATASMTGFATITQTDLRVSANQNVNSSFTMKAGATTDTVTVDADAALVDTRESQIAETVDQKRIVDLPLANRNAYDLVTLVPGITNYNASAQIGDNGGTQFSTNGTRPNFNSFYLDGAYNTSFFRGGGNIVPAPDALAQFRIITSNFDSEFGRYPGAVVNTITRSGNNAFHGVAYDYLRNRIFNARNYFTQPGNSPQYIYNVFGGGVGGPIVRDKLFFFASYQGTRIREQTTINPTDIIVPSDLERMGDFSASIKKPTALPGAQCGTTAAPKICSNKLDPVAQNVLKYVPHYDPALTDKAGYHPDTQQLPSPTTADQGVGRLDYQLNQAHRLSFTYFNSQGAGFNRKVSSNNLLTYSGLSTYAGQSNYVLRDNWIISPNMVNSFTLFYTLNKTNAAPLYQTAHFSDLGMQIGNGGPIITQPQMIVTGYFTGGGSGINNQTQLTSGIEDTFNWTHGRHQVKFGGSMIFNKYQETGSFLSSAKLTFNGNASVGGQTKNGLADFLLGRAQSFQQNNGVLHRFHAWDPSLFLQDNWRITRRLTANLGVRWEVYYPFSGQKNLGTFIEGVQSTRFPTAPVGLLTEGDPGVPEGVLHVSYKKFAPRIGFAWDIFGDGKSSLRGAYGLFYSFSQETFIGNLEQQPFQLAVVLNSTTNLVNPYAGQAAFPSGSPFPYVVDPANPTFVNGATISGLKPYSSTVPYLQQFNLTLEQQYGTNWSTRISYVGNVGRHFYLSRDQNSPVYGPGATLANAASRRPLSSQGYVSGVGLLDPSSNSSYSSLQLVATRRLQHNFSVQAFYVWSKAMDTISVDPGNATSYTLSDEYNPGRDRGLSNLDMPHRFVASFIYQLPAVNRWGLFGKEVLSGWQLNGIETLATGNPFNITSNVDTNLDTVANTDRPDLIGNPYLDGGRSKRDKIDQYFNTAAYVVPTGGRLYGNSPRNPLIGPGTVNTDISAFKRFVVHEQANLLFRAEFFNLFNNTNLNNPNGVLGNGNFGRITGAADPRQMQLALKFEF
ncbi:MAG: carboxypeptidase regulatory-like domain-containing protein [Acidobacteria bacterium]|nr:carboxypeptidase regulatory-like domain-containing protein [Acidobacteriota bacterium]